MFQGLPQTRWASGRHPVLDTHKQAGCSILSGTRADASLLSVQNLSGCDLIP